MRIDFNEVEMADLEEAVRAHEKELLFELSRTDDRAYQAMLRDKCERIERLIIRLESLPEQGLQEITP